MFKEVKYLSHKLKDIIWLFLFLVFTLNCSFVSIQQTKGDMQEYIHKNNLVVSLPKNLSAKETNNGFIIEPSDGSNKNVRFPIEFQVDLFDDKNNVFADETLTKNKAIKNRSIKYQIEKDEGGSGGETYTFIGYETLDKGYIKYSQSLQSKYDEPDFATIWQIIENTSIKK